MNRHLPCVHRVVLFLLVPYVLTAQHQNSLFMPLTSSEVGRPFPLKPLGVLKANSSALPSHAGPSGALFRVSPTVSGGALELEGKDKAGKTWQIDIFELWGCADGAHVYEADLDADSVQDIVLLMPTCGNGLAPSAHMVAITFDTVGRPILFEAEGYFEEKSNGIDSLVDLNRDGKADLIFMNFNDGYWITNAYSVNRGRWTRVQGSFSGRTFPLYTRFTNQPNNRAVIPPSTRHPWAPDLSNATPVLTGVIVDWDWPNGNVRGGGGPSDLDLHLTILAGGHQTVCSPEYWFDSARLVLDQAEGRTIRHLTANERSTVDAMLQELVAKKVPIQLYGRRSSDHCSPELLWAGQK